MKFRQLLVLILLLSKLALAEEREGLGKGKALSKLCPLCESCLYSYHHNNWVS